MTPSRRRRGTFLRKHFARSVAANATKLDFEQHPPSEFWNTLHGVRSFRWPLLAGRHIDVEQAAELMRGFPENPRSPQSENRLEAFERLILRCPTRRRDLEPLLAHFSPEHRPTAEDILARRPSFRELEPLFEAPYCDALRDLKVKSNRASVTPTGVAIHAFGTDLTLKGIQIREALVAFAPSERLAVLEFLWTRWDGTAPETLQDVFPERDRRQVAELLSRPPKPSERRQMLAEPDIYYDLFLVAHEQGNGKEPFQGSTLKRKGTRTLPLSAGGLRVYLSVVRPGRRMRILRQLAERWDGTGDLSLVASAFSDPADQRAAMALLSPGNGNSPVAGSVGVSTWVKRGLRGLF